MGNLKEILSYLLGECIKCLPEKLVIPPPSARYKETTSFTAKGFFVTVTITLLNTMVY